MPQRTNLASFLILAGVVSAGPAFSQSGTFTFVTRDVNVQRRDGPRDDHDVPLGVFEVRGLVAPRPLRERRQAAGAEGGAVDRPDVPLPGSRKVTVPFLMYPQGETAAGMLDSLDPSAFSYRITSHELTTPS